MKALLVISHGSRRDESNMEVQRLTDTVRPLVSERFGIVEAAFLELASPLIPDGISLCVSQGAKEILILPYFLAAGRHVAEDIPEIVAASQKRHPDVSMTIAPHLGGSELMAEFLAGSACLPQE
ncbi:MAG: CbiX/SirB N-terminal domain-containing protein [Gammaproteobacteria bacterium]|nr:CbiX/SirB N-terminal domain-containing protein [Gammaproteobacteria bacterium]